MLGCFANNFPSQICELSDQGVWEPPNALRSRTSVLFTVLGTDFPQDNACTSRCSASLPLVSLDGDNRLYVAWPILQAGSSPYIPCIVPRLRRHPALSEPREAYHRRRKEPVVLGRRSSEKYGPISYFELHRVDTPAWRYKWFSSRSCQYKWNPERRALLYQAMEVMVAMDNVNSFRMIPREALCRKKIIRGNIVIGQSYNATVDVDIMP